MPREAASKGWQGGGAKLQLRAEVNVESSGAEMTQITQKEVLVLLLPLLELSW
jgi:hypothetical protein